MGAPSLTLPRAGPLATRAPNPVPAPPKAPRLLLFTDLSPASDGWLERAARWAAERGASVQLAYHPLDRVARFDDPLARLAQRARRLGRSFGVAVQALERRLHTPAEVLALLPHCTLVGVALPVTAPRRAWQAHDLLALLLQARQVPVWVLRDEPCETPVTCLCAVSLQPASAQLLRWAVAWQGAGTIELLHVARAPATSWDSSALGGTAVIEQAWRQQRIAAHQVLSSFTGPWARRGLRFEHQVMEGPRDEVIAQRQRALRPALLVLGLSPGWRWPWRVSAVDGLARGLAGDVLLVPLAAAKQKTGWGGLWRCLFD